MIVLFWLRKAPSAAKTYVANRVAETSQLTKLSTWRHVPTKDNPADMASRGVSADNIVNATLWWEGPTWIAQSAHEWPKSEFHLTEEHKAAIASESSPPIVLLARRPEPFLENGKGDLLPQSSSAHRLIRVTAWIIRFVSNIKKNATRAHGPLTAEEYVTAEVYSIRDEQKEHFAEEVSCLTEGAEVAIPKKSKLYGLNPFIEEGVLRARGRLERANLARDSI